LKIGNAEQIGSPEGPSGLQASDAGGGDQVRH
jgi:hypothetical protein